MSRSYLQRYSMTFAFSKVILEVNLFTTHVNRKCIKHFSWAGFMKRSWGGRYFTVYWTQKNPPLLLHRVIVKLCQDKANTILVALWWLCQPLFAILKHVAMDICLPPLIPDLITQVSGTVCPPDLPHLRLATWKIHWSSKELCLKQENYPPDITVRINWELVSLILLHHCRDLTFLLST